MTTKPRTSARMHEVKADLANFELAKARSSLTLNIYANGAKIGALEIGRGSLYWHGRSRQQSKRLYWSRFADMMDDLAYGRRRVDDSPGDMMSRMAPAPRARRKVTKRK